MSLKVLAEHLRAQGRGPDTELVHLTKREVRAMEGLAKAAGGSLTRNPKTGLPEAGFLDSLLPTILGGAANFFIPGSGMIVGGLTGALQNKENPLMGAALGAAGGYGGAQIGQGLSNMGQAAAVDSMITGAAQNALPSAAQAAGQGLMSAMTDPGTAMSYLGGPMGAAKMAGMAAAPLLGEQFGLTGAPQEDEAPDWAKAKGKNYRYDAGYTGGEMTGTDPSSERRWFDPRFTALAKGGAVSLREGDFVIPADVVSMAGGGSTSAGLRELAQHVGARPIRGPGTGLSDSIPASINGAQPARVADGEAYVPREQVMAKGGPAKFYGALANIRKQAHGKTQQQKPVNVQKAFK